MPAKGDIFTSAPQSDILLYAKMPPKPIAPGIIFGYPCFDKDAPVAPRQNDPNYCANKYARAATLTQRRSTRTSLIPATLSKRRIENIENPPAGTCLAWVFSANLRGSSGGLWAEEADSMLPSRRSPLCPSAVQSCVVSMAHYHRPLGR